MKFTATRTFELNAAAIFRSVPERLFAGRSGLHFCIHPPDLIAVDMATL
jgi:hypothetical protein